MRNTEDSSVKYGGVKEAGDFDEQPRNMSGPRAQRSAASSAESMVPNQPNLYAAHQLALE